MWNSPPPHPRALGLALLCSASLCSSAPLRDARAAPPQEGSGYTLGPIGRPSLCYCHLLRLLSLSTLSPPSTCAPPPPSAPPHSTGGRATLGVSPSPSTCISAEPSTPLAGNTRRLRDELIHELPLAEQLVPLLRFSTMPSSLRGPLLAPSTSSTDVEIPAPPTHVGLDPLEAETPSQPRGCCPALPSPSRPSVLPRTGGGKRPGMHATRELA
jgi:hypothetical protein